MLHGRVTTSHIKAVTGTTFVATLSALLFGYCTAVIAGVIGAIDLNFIAPRGLSATAANLLLGLTVCAALLGTVVGALSARRIATRLGRRRPMIVAAVMFLVSAIGSAYPEIGFARLDGLGPDAIWPFIVYRFIGGLAVGLASVIGPMTVSEFAPSAVRGQLGSYQQVAIAGGVCIALFVIWGIGLQGDDRWVLETGWRYMMLSLAVPSIAFLCLSITVPESAAWLLRRGRIDDARRELARSAEPHEVEATLVELAREGAAVQPAAPLFSFGARVVWIGIGVSALQQFSGLNALSYYGAPILQRMGYHMDEAFLGMLIARTLNLFATMIVVLIVDRVGRRPLLAIGGFTIGGAMLVIGCAFQATDAAHWGLFGMTCFMVGFGMSFGPIVWILMSEMYPAPIRAQAMTLAIGLQWVANFLVSATFPVLFGDSWLDAHLKGGAPFFVYAVFGFATAWVVLRYVPETKGIDAQSVVSLWRRESQEARA